MKNFILAVVDQTKTLSPKLMLVSFMAGYSVAILLFTFFRPQVHHFLDLIF